MAHISMKTLLLGASLFGIAGLSAYSALAQSSNATTVYRASLSALPNTSGTGQATLRLSADQTTLTVNIKASGLEAGGAHISHIHGLSSGGAPVDSTCPTIAQDSDSDGFVELDEGLVTYGPILIDFSNIDPDQDGTIDFTTTITLGSEGALPLTDRHIVVHGMTVGAVGAGTPGEVDGTAEYKVVLPVLCGEIKKVNSRNPLQFVTPGGSD